MIRKSLIIFAAALCITVSPAFAVLMVQSMSVTNVGTAFVGGVGSALTMNGVGGINVEYSSGTVTYGSGQFSLNTTLASDASVGGIASGTFTGGSILYKDSSSAVLLSGTITSLKLTEAYNGSGLFFGDGSFTVTGGSLQPNFGSAGVIVDISYSIKPITISTFASSFNGSSDMTILPVPEPMTIGLLGLGGLSLLRRKR